MHEVDRVIQWTLQVQAPTLADPVECGCGNKTSERIEGKKSSKYNVDEYQFSSCKWEL